MSTPSAEQADRLVSKALPCDQVGRNTSGQMFRMGEGDVLAWFTVKGDVLARFTVKGDVLARFTVKGNGRRGPLGPHVK
ncbi:MAG TPA: hypothetical protein O0X69_00440 [Methanocorpusculum sp.]|nr:hypothetical protein [Methanocorpusculum sp.]